MVAVEHGALVVQRAGRIVGADPPRERIVVHPVTAFVAEAPFDDAGMVAVALHHSCPALDECAAVPRVVADAGVVGVALDVRLVDHVHAQFVAEVVEGSVVGVVRGANGGDVVGAHHLEIGADIGRGERLTAVGMMVVAVHTVDPDRLAVHQQLPADHFHPLDTDALRGGFQHRTVGADQFDGGLVQRRRFRRPCRRLGYFP